MKSLGHRKKILGAIRELSSRRNVKRAIPEDMQVLVVSLPSVLAVPLREYLEETHAIMRLHRMCDALEILTRFVTLAGWADLMETTGNRPPRKLLEAFASRILRPTFGMWANMLRTLARQAPDSDFLPELESWVLKELDSILGKGEQEPERCVIPLRNLLAHGGGITHESGRRLLAGHEPRVLDVWRKAGFLCDVELVQVRGGRFRVLRGPADFFEKDIPESLSGLARHENRVALVRHGRARIVWPMFHHGFASVPDSYSGASQASEASAWLYMRSENKYIIYNALWGDIPISKNTDFFEDFQKIFLLAAVRQAANASVVEDFVDEIRLDAENLVGRRKESGILSACVKNSRDVILWVSGPAGIGKSMLMAKLALDISNAPRKDRLVVAYRFKTGDSRCTRLGFLRLAVREISAWLAHDLRVGQEEPLQHAGLPELEARFSDLTKAVAGLMPSGKRQKPPQLIPVLDGMDEIARIDPKFLDLIRQNLRANVLWVCAGRPEGHLLQIFSLPQCRQVFPDGLPGMSIEDVRAMLLEGSLKKKYDLLRRDRETSSGTIDNVFVETVLARAKGLPLYVRFVLDDILRGEIGFSDESRLTKGLSVYYAEVMQRLGVGDLQALLTPPVVLLAWAQGSLSLNALYDLIRFGQFVDGGPDARDLLARAVECIRSLVYPVARVSGSLLLRGGRIHPLS